MYSIKVINTPFYPLYGITAECYSGAIILLSRIFLKQPVCAQRYCISESLSSGTAFFGDNSLLHVCIGYRLRVCTRRQCGEVTCCVLHPGNMIMTTDALDLLQGHFLLCLPTLCLPRPSQGWIQWQGSHWGEMTKKTSWAHFTGIRKRGWAQVRSPRGNTWFNNVFLKSHPWDRLTQLPLEKGTPVSGGHLCPRWQSSWENIQSRKANKECCDITVAALMEAQVS